MRYEEATAKRSWAVKGALVQTLWNTGAFGLQVLYGEVIAAGDKTISVRWESGIVNRLRQDRYLDRDVHPAEDLAAARAALSGTQG